MQLRELMRQRAEEKAKKAEQLKKTLQQSKNKDQVMHFGPCEGSATVMSLMTVVIWCLQLLAMLRQKVGATEPPKKEKAAKQKGEHASGLTPPGFSNSCIVSIPTSDMSI